MRFPAIFAIALVASFLATSGFGESPLVQEFASGKKTRFTTKGHSKSMGLTITLDYPASWQEKDGDRPHIVKKFVPKAGGESETALLAITEIGEKVSDQDIREIATAEGAKGILPEGVKLHKASLTAIDGTPAAMLEYSKRSERAGVTVELYYLAYYFSFGTKLIQFQGSVGMAPTTAEALEARMREFKPLYQQMAASIVIMEKW